MTFKNLFFLVPIYDFRNASGNVLIMGLMPGHSAFS